MEKNHYEKIWNSDKTKIDIAIQSGYNVVTIWQYDWEHTTDKKDFLERIVNGTYK